MVLYYKQCKECNGTNFKLEEYEGCVDIICSHCFNKETFNRYGELHECIGETLEVQE